MQVLEDNKRKTNMIQRHQKDQETAENAYKSEAAERNRVCTQFFISYTSDCIRKKKLGRIIIFWPDLEPYNSSLVVDFHHDLSSHGDNFVWILRQSFPTYSTGDDAEDDDGWRVKQLWDEKLHEFHKGVVEHAAKLKRQQIGSLQAFRQRMAAKTPVKPQWSRELLKHRKVQVN
jgi:hypothetical protein